MFFKKAIDDATSEWAQHHAKRYIDTKAKASRAEAQIEPHMHWCPAVPQADTAQPCTP